LDECGEISSKRFLFWLDAPVQTANSKASDEEFELSSGHAVLQTEFVRHASKVTCRFIKTGDDVVLEWLDTKSDTFVRRFKFKEADAVAEMPGPALTNFRENLKPVYYFESPFVQKLIVCRLDQSMKKTVAGNKMKITGPPRFGEDATSTVHEIGDADAVRAVLESQFGIPFQETEGLDLSKSLGSSTRMWMK